RFSRDWSSDVCSSDLAVLLTLGLPTLASAQQPAPVDRVRSWEFSLGGGITILDKDLLDALSAGPSATRFTKSGDPGRVLPTGARSEERRVGEGGGSRR